MHANITFLNQLSVEFIYTMAKGQLCALIGDSVCMMVSFDYSYQNPSLFLFRRANNMFIFFSCSKLVLQITNGFVYATLVTESASAPSTNDL